MDTQDSISGTLGEKRRPGEAQRQILLTESLDDTINSIMSEVESTFRAGQQDTAAISALLKRLTAAISRCADSIGSEPVASGALTYLTSVLIPLSALASQSEQPRNVFREIHLGEYTLLGLLSPWTAVTIRTISSGHHGIQYLHFNGRPGVDGVLENAISVVGNGDDAVKNDLTEYNLKSSISRFIQKGYRLVRRRQVVFRNIELKQREMMLILSCTDPIIVHNVKGEESSVFIAGQVSMGTIRWLSDVLDVAFDPNEPDGVFQTELIS